MIRVLFLLLFSTLSAEVVLVEGAGPVGLYAALEFYEAGHDVTLVNSRERYTRRQIVSLDLEWVEKLKVYAPDELEKWVQDGVARPTISGNLEVPIKVLEEMLYSAVKRRAIQTHYGVKVLGLEGNQAQVGGMSLYFERIYFCGGENDALRTKYLSVPTYSRSPIKYSLYIYDRKAPVSLGVSQEDQSGIIETVSFSGPIVQAKLGELVDLVEDESLELANSVGHVLNRLAYELESGHPIEYRLFENREQLYVAFEINSGYFDWLVEMSNSKSTLGCVVNFINEIVLNQIFQCRGIDSSTLILDKRSSATFAVEQMMCPRTNAKIAGGGVLGVALGDALVSPHFFSGSGLTYGRMSVEAAVEGSDLSMKLRAIQLLSMKSGERPGQATHLPFPEKVLLSAQAEKPLMKDRRIYKIDERRYLLECEGGNLYTFTVELEEVFDQFLFYKLSYKSGDVHYNCIADLLFSLP